LFLEPKREKRRNKNYKRAADSNYYEGKGKGEAVLKRKRGKNEKLITRRAEYIHSGRREAAHCSCTR